jgi:hypothetical protein
MVEVLALPGDHVYVNGDVPPETVAVSVVAEPEQMTGAVGVIATLKPGEMYTL